MALIFDAVHRLEADPRQTDPARGFRAEVAEPAWLLGRQWQLGEHAGEDASSPVRLTFRARHTAIDPVSGQPDLDPRTTPAEAIIESEPGDSWTPGRRITAGRIVAGQAAAAGGPPRDIAADRPDRQPVGRLVRLSVNARAGHVVTLDDVIVHDSFGEEWTLEPPQESIYTTAGLDRRSLVVWATAATPLAGPVLDEVVIGIDEDANLVWAVEQRLRGRSVPTDADPPPEPPARIDASGRAGSAYRPMTRIPPHWHPYVIEEVAGRRRFVQGRAADLSGPTAVLLPEAESDLLIDPASGGTHPTHQLEPAAVPSEGVRVERRTMLARATDGSPVLWTQRRRAPLLAPPGQRLRFDVMEPVPPT